MSSEPKWTKGPWSLSYDTGSTRDVVASPDPKPICTVKQGWVTREEYIANAQLIFSATKLYDELAHLVRLLEPMERGGTLNIPGLATLNGARTALASARGES